MLVWLRAHAGWIALLSGATFVGSLIAIPLILIALPADYFALDLEQRRKRPPEHPVLRIVRRIVKNVLGALFLMAGLAMLFTPGQGVLTILVGVILLDLPGKRRLERSLVGRPRVLRAINALRARAKRPPLEL